MTAKRRYARVFHDLRTDIPVVWGHDAMFGVWMKLYIHADAVWPDTPECPRGIDEELFERLGDCRAVVRDGDDPYRYRVPVLDNDRKQAVIDGHRNATKRWVEKEGKPPPPPPELPASLDGFYDRNPKPEMGTQWGPNATNGTAQDVTKQNAREAALPAGAPRSLKDQGGHR